ncbi:MAG: hypothetical protein HYY93_11340 [Planctomycetes bacterium]|nr:hypothetical protein [Planctomycetota bacterium]
MRSTVEPQRDTDGRRGILLAELAVVILLLGITVFTVAHMFQRLARGVRTETEYAIAEDVLAAQFEYLRTRTDEEIADAKSGTWPYPMEVTRCLPGAEIVVDSSRVGGDGPWRVKIVIRWQVVETGAREVSGESVLRGRGP